MTSAKARPRRGSGSAKSGRSSNGSGPKNGLYQKLLAKGRIPKKPYSKLSKLERSRLHDLRAMERRSDGKYKRLALWVKGVRDRLKIGQKEFAEKLGVSVITVRRYECSLGSYPSPATMERLRVLAGHKTKAR